MTLFKSLLTHLYTKLKFYKVLKSEFFWLFGVAPYLFH